MIVNMIQNWSYKYYSHNSNIKYVDTIIKCIDFESILYPINLDTVSSSMIFNDFDYIYISIDVLLV